jgi:DNA-binding response OmpR family regulator
MAWIYMVEDDADIAHRVCDLLVRHGHQTQWFDTPHKLFYELGKRRPALVLVDWMLPEMPGVDVVARVRQLLGRSVAILMLTALESEESVVLALQTGADDYVIKPSTDALILARVEALLRRMTQAAPASVIAIGPYRFEFSQQSATIGGQAVELTPREFDLAWTLFSQPSRLVTKDELQAAIWGKGSDLGHHTIAQHVYLLRKKLELSKFGARLVAVYASGYRLELPEVWTRIQAESA